MKWQIIIKILCVLLHHDTVAATGAKDSVCVGEIRNSSKTVQMFTGGKLVLRVIMALTIKSMSLGAKYWKWCGLPRESEKTATPSWRLTVSGTSRLSHALLTSRGGRSTLLGGKSYVVLGAVCLVEDVAQHGRVVRAHDAVRRRLQRLRERSLSTPSSIPAQRLRHILVLICDTKL